VSAAQEHIPRPIGDFTSAAFLSVRDEIADVADAQPSTMVGAEKQEDIDEVFVPSIPPRDPIYTPLDIRISHFVVPRYCGHTHIRPTNHYETGKPASDATPEDARYQPSAGR